MEMDFYSISNTTCIEIKKNLEVTTHDNIWHTPNHENSWFVGTFWVGVACFGQLGLNRNPEDPSLRRAKMTYLFIVLFCSFVLFCVFSYLSPYSYMLFIELSWDVIYVYETFTHNVHVIMQFYVQWNELNKP